VDEASVVVAALLLPCPRQQAAVRQYGRDLESLPTIFSAMAKAAATKNTHATSIDIGIMLVGKECMPIPKRIANEISTKYLTYFFTQKPFGLKTRVRFP
jgi:hypothetical protein